MVAGFTIYFAKGIALFYLSGMFKYIQQYRYMNITKKRAVFERNADVYKLLAHPVRLEILHLLCQKERAVSDLVELLELRQPVVSQHLSLLRRAGYVVSRRDGQRVIYGVHNHEASDTCASARDLHSSLSHKTH